MASDPLTTEQIDAMVADADLNDTTTADVYLGEWVRALAAEVKRQRDEAFRATLRVRDEAVQKCIDARNADVATIVAERDQARAELARALKLLREHLPACESEDKWHAWRVEKNAFLAEQQEGKAR